MFVFGVAITNEVRNLKVTVCDHDSSELSRQILTKISAGGYFIIHRKVGTPVEAEDDLLYNRSRLALIFPPGFQSSLRRGENAKLQILMDGTDGNTAAVALGYLQRMLLELDGGPAVFLSTGIFPPRFGLVRMETRVFYNQGLESANYLIPGVVTMILTILTILLTAMGITKEKEAGTFEQLVVSPIRGIELMAGKTIPYAIIGFFDAMVVTVISVFVFKVPMNGSPWMLALLNLVYVIAMLGLGLFISTVSRSQQQAMMTVFAFLLPAIILSGFFFPLENMPLPIQWLTHINPMKYVLSAQRDIFLRGSEMSDLYDTYLILVGFAVVFLGAGVFRFRRTLSM
jgi:ABC-2 type transport system permease protein